MFWRSSPRGVDARLSSCRIPNHPWFGDRTRPWFLPPRPDAFPEFVGVVFARRARRDRVRRRGGALLPPFWVAFTAFFAVLSLGPFVHVAGVNTYVIGPWALLRYVPLIGMARSPSRFAVVATLGLSLLLALRVPGALASGGRRAWRLGWRSSLALLRVELLPAPRPLHSAAVPEVYDMVGEREQPRRIGTSARAADRHSRRHVVAGKFQRAAAFFQTRHRRPMVGGYLSRVSSWRKVENMRMPMLGALTRLSQGGSLSSEDAERASDARDAFLARSCTRFVLVNRRRASAELHEFARRTLRLTPVAQDPDYALYTPVDPPPCAPASAPRRLTDMSWLWQGAE